MSCSSHNGNLGILIYINHNIISNKCQNFHLHLVSGSYMAKAKFDMIADPSILGYMFLITMVTWNNER